MVSRNKPAFHQKERGRGWRRQKGCREKQWQSCQRRTAGSLPSVRVFRLLITKKQRCPPKFQLLRASDTQKVKGEMGEKMESLQMGKPAEQR